MSDKIKPHHLERKAILYIRQSSVYQVNHNLESQKLQYAMKERLRQLGWREIEVVDDDLGRSAAGTVTRAGFERMVAEVCLGKVGAVAARTVLGGDRPGRPGGRRRVRCRGCCEHSREISRARCAPGPAPPPGRSGRRP